MSDPVSLLPPVTLGDRSNLLLEAADYMDGRFHELGGAAAEEEAPEAKLLRDLLRDVAAFADLPVVHEMTGEAGAAGGGPQLASVYFPLLLKPARAWSYSRLDLGVSLDADAGGRRPKVVEILPPKRFADRLRTEGKVDLKLGADGRFKVSTGEIDVQVGPAAATVGAGVDAHAAASIGFTAQPFTYRLRKTEIDHTQVGTEDVYWELNGTEFFEDNVPAFVIVAEVPDEAKELKLAAAMRVFRKFDSAGAPMIDAIKALPKALARFLKGGAPLEVTGTWNIGLESRKAQANG